MDGEAIRKAVSVGVSALVSGGHRRSGSQRGPRLRSGRCRHRLGKDRADADRHGRASAISRWPSGRFGCWLAGRGYRPPSTVPRKYARASCGRKSSIPIPEGEQRGFDRRVANRHDAGSRRDGADYSRSVFRRIGKVADLPARIADARFGIARPACSRWRSILKKRIVVPRANVELIESWRMKSAEVQVQGPWSEDGRRRGCRLAVDAWHAGCARRTSSAAAAGIDLGDRPSVGRRDARST